VAQLMGRPMPDPGSRACLLEAVPEVGEVPPRADRRREHETVVVPRRAHCQCLVVLRNPMYS
jgi:hypothetical protein